MNVEWKRRIDRWRDVMGTMLYSPLGSIDFKGFTTLKQLSVEEAQRGSFGEMPPGTLWGAKWEYGRKWV